MDQKCFIKSVAFGNNLDNKKDFKKQTAGMKILWALFRNVYNM